jgi:hypothetical protein
MKKITLSVLLLSIFIGFQFHSSAQGIMDAKTEALFSHFQQQFNQALDNQQRDIISLPQKEHLYSWQSTAWVEDLYEEISYNPNGSTNIIISYDPGSSAPSTRTTYSYDASGRITQMLTESWNGSGWDYVFKFTQSYDTHGNEFESVSSYWAGTSWMMVSGTRSTYSYTTSDFVQQIVYEGYVTYQGWMFLLKDIFTLDISGYPTDILYQKYTTGWVDTARYVDITWHMYDPYSGNGAYSFYEKDDWSGTSWMPSLQSTTTYDGSGGSVETQQSYIGGVWVNYMRYTDVISQNLAQSSKTEQWLGGLWVQTEGYLYNYTFSGIDITELIMQSYVQESASYENSARIVFSDFLHITDIDNPSIGNDVNIYPNPASNLLNFTFDRINGTSLVIEILSIDGQMVYYQKTGGTAMSQTFTVDITPLPQGIYILRLTGDNTSQVSRFIKE